MKQTNEPKAMMPNRIPITLINACKLKAEKENLSLNEWLQKVLIKATK